MNDQIVLLTEIRDLLVQLVGAKKQTRSQKKKDAPIMHWQEMVSHIDSAWTRKKGSKYPFAVQDMVKLKTYAKLYMPWGVMALWDLFLSCDDPFYRQTGYKISAFASGLPKLLDMNWKSKAEEYRKKLEATQPETKEEMVNIGGLLAGLTNGKKLPI